MTVDREDLPEAPGIDNLFRPVDHRVVTPVMADQKWQSGSLRRFDQARGAFDAVG